MFTDCELETLIKAMRHTGVTELAVEQNGETLCLGLAPGRMSSAPATPASPPPNSCVKSPAMGLFVPVGGDDGLEAVATGSRVAQGQILGYVADGDVRIPLTAPSAGTLASKAPEASAVIGYSDVVFEIEAD